MTEYVVEYLLHGEWYFMARMQDGERAADLSQSTNSLWGVVTRVRSE
jgi:hypothetical protein